MRLCDTAPLMASEDYKERFIAEYVQAEIRYRRLAKLMDKVKNNNLPDCFTPTCPIDILDMQRVEMAAYLAILKKRAEIEEITLPEIEED